MALLNNRLKVVTIVGLIWMVISLVVFLLVTHDRIPAQNYGLFFLLLTEAITIAFLAFQELAPAGTGSLFRMGSYVAVPVYAIFSIPIAIVFCAGWVESKTWLIISEMVLFGLLISIEIFLYRTSRSTADTDRLTAAKMGIAMDLGARLDSLAKLRTLPPELSSRFNRVIEEIRFFDKNASTASDTTIGEKISQLEGLFSLAKDDVPLGADKILDEIYALTQVRKREASYAQRGGF
ncbi:MAG: hypothetical protein LBJ61_12945 [Deltaproteobacteria bacterium]|jgi:hypothetical protein|nr:hypothetical protein [Deltaproteobacteria bacterium]